MTSNQRFMLAHASGGDCRDHMANAPNSRCRTRASSTTASGSSQNKQGMMIHTIHITVQSAEMHCCHSQLCPGLNSPVEVKRSHVHGLDETHACNRTRRQEESRPTIYLWSLRSEGADRLISHACVHRGECGNQGDSWVPVESISKAILTAPLRVPSVGTYSQTLGSGVRRTHPVLFNTSFT